MPRASTAALASASIERRSTVLTLLGKNDPVSRMVQ